MTHYRRAFSPGRRVTPGATRQDETEVFIALVRRYERPIFGFLYQMIGNAEDAADLTQETFLKAYHALGRTSDDLNAGAWLHRIARNCCLDALRRRHICWQPWDVAAEGRAAGGEEDPERTFLRDEESCFVHEVLYRMSPRNRQALVLRVCDDLSCRDVGVAMGVTEGAARAQLVRAREEFRRVTATAAHDPADHC